MKPKSDFDRLLNVLERATFIREAYSRAAAMQGWSDTDPRWRVLDEAEAIKAGCADILREMAGA